MRFAWLNLWNDRRRTLVGVLAIAISTVLVCVFTGLLLGLLSIVTGVIDRSPAHVWLTSSNTPSHDLGQPIDRDWRNALLMDPAVAATDEAIMTYTLWKDPERGVFLIQVLGISLGDGGLGPLADLPRELRDRLTEPGAVIVDRTDRHRLGIDRIGQHGEVLGRRVRVVGYLDDLPSLSGPYIVCSLQTARALLGLRSDQTTFVLARCRSRADVPGLLSRAQSWRDVTAASTEDFSARSRHYWLQVSKVGHAVTFVTALALVIAAMVTSQSQYAATAALVKELALLRALGATRRRVRLFVLQQSLVVGSAGVALGLPASYALARVAEGVGVRALLPAWLTLFAAGLTLAMALLSGLFSLRALRQSDPAQPLR